LIALAKQTTIRCIYGIVKFVNLAMQNNPNIIDWEDAHRASSLPERPTARPALNDLLVRLRTGLICRS
jgi:hypothetical protein